MDEMRQKYPRTPHLPWSQGRTADDTSVDSVAHLEALPEVVVTEKLDGENTTMYSDFIHARSLEGAPHPSRTWVKRFHATIRGAIPPGVRVCGENLYARHSIAYSELPSYFLVFAICEREQVLSWDDTLEWCELLGFEPVPQLYRGPWDEDAIRRSWTGISRFGGEQEGYVVRNAGVFPFSAFGRNTAKFVRAGHVTDEEHWMARPVVPNKLRGSLDAAR